MVFILEILGTIAFAISGAMVGVESSMDIFGVSVMGLTTAIGGGIMRDVVIGNTPPEAFSNPVYAIIAIVVSLIIFIPFVRESIDINNSILNAIDAIGLGIFTVMGVEMGAPYNNIALQIFLGVITGVGGGILRDMFATKKPKIFVKNIYALASIIGAVLCIIINPINENAAMIVGAVVIVIIRILAAKNEWHLPRIK